MPGPSSPITSRPFQKRAGRSRSNRSISILSRKFLPGRSGDLLRTTDERGKLAELIPVLKLDAILDHQISTLSGGELQRVAIAACLARNADLYFLDEITPFLDIYQRISAAKLIRELAMDRPVVIVEHDLAILDMLADTVHVGYGKPAVFGVITRPKGVRVGINQYLEGYLAEENVRFRDSQVVFEKRAHEKGSKSEDLVDIPALTKKYRYLPSHDLGWNDKGRRSTGGYRGKRYGEEHLCETACRGGETRYRHDGHQTPDLV